MSTTCVVDVNNPNLCCSRRIERMVERGARQLKELEVHLSQLKEEVGEREEDGSDEEGEIPVIPVHYLANREPYVCGVAECRQLFHTYNELVLHAASHPNTALCSIYVVVSRIAITLNNQLMIPDGRYHCPVHDCEVGDGLWCDLQYGYGRKALPFDLLRLHYHVRPMVGSNP